MDEKVLNCKVVADEILKSVAAEIYLGHCKLIPRLAVMLCTDDHASKVYVSKKVEACKQVGVESVVIKPFDGTSPEKWDDPTDYLCGIVDWLNKESSIHGVLIQLPLPNTIDNFKLFDKINPLKDVDVLSPENVGLLVQGRPRYLPCTPQGIQRLLKYYKIDTCGKRICIINRSNILGKPLSSMLIQNSECANATVCLCHDKTLPEDLLEICHWADIIVVAVGIRDFLKDNIVKSHHIVLDVGINKKEDGKICGDCCPSIYNIVSKYTKVPNGIGTLTVASLLNNTLEAYNKLNSL